MSAQPALKTLVVYDAPTVADQSKLGLGYAIMLKNLIGHFDASVDLLPAHQYAAGKIEAYNAVFYLGAHYNHALPTSFVADVAATKKTVVWFKYNLWQLTQERKTGFAKKFGFKFARLRGMNATPSSSNPEPGFFNTVTYKNKAFVKYYAYDKASNRLNADPDIGEIKIDDAAKAKAQVFISNAKTSEALPYVVRAKNFWYVADLPFSYVGPRDRYLVLADLLHDMLGIDHPESHKAMVRIEDVGAMVSVSAMKTLTDYLHKNKIPFSIAVIPRFVDATGIYNNGVPRTVPLSQAVKLKKVLDYALPRGAEIVMHGYTHQHAVMGKGKADVSGEGYEFWNIEANSPVEEDTANWTLSRLKAGLEELTSNGYTPVAWATPHYHASSTASKTVPQVFNTTYQRVVYFTADNPDFQDGANKDFALGQFFPYVIKKDHYGQRILPETLGNIEHSVYSSEDILINADYLSTVRDGYASFFFHSFLLERKSKVSGLAEFKNIIEGITARGYTWTAASAAN